MTVPELIKIIKKKRLYKGACFEIAVEDFGNGDYSSDSWRVIAGSCSVACESEGIYRKKKRRVEVYSTGRTWRLYLLS